MSTIGSSALRRLATAWPPRTAPRPIGSDRNRSMAPFVRSEAIAMATPKDPPKTIVWAKIPPMRNSL
jgi:hypothetical protein